MQLQFRHHGAARPPSGAGGGGSDTGAGAGSQSEPVDARAPKFVMSSETRAHGGCALSNRGGPATLPLCLFLLVVISRRRLVD